MNDVRFEYNDLWMNTVCDWVHMIVLEEVRLKDHDNKDDPIQAIRTRLRMRSGKRDLHGEGHHCCASALMVGTLLAMLLSLLVASQHGQ